MELTVVLELILKKRRISYTVKIHKETGESSNVLVVTKWHSWSPHTGSILSEGLCGNRALDSKGGVWGYVV